jgi:hypothetical protein
MKFKKYHFGTFDAVLKGWVHFIIILQAANFVIDKLHIKFLWQLPRMQDACSLFSINLASSLVSGIYC